VNAADPATASWETHVMAETAHVAGTGQPQDWSLEALRAGALGAEDFRISRDQLEVQASAAQRAGYRQLAENLRRAAELTGLSNERVFEIYNLLRPGRARLEELENLASELRGQGMPRVAAFIDEAAAAYRARGILKRQP
jgi:propanediol dehydratase small subunit